MDAIAVAIVRLSIVLHLHLLFMHFIKNNFISKIFKILFFTKMSTSSLSNSGRLNTVLGTEAPLQTQQNQPNPNRNTNGTRVSPLDILIQQNMTQEEQNVNQIKKRSADFINQFIVLCGLSSISLAFATILLVFKLSLSLLVFLLLPLETMVLGFRFFQIRRLSKESKNRYEFFCQVVSSYYIDPISRLFFYALVVLSIVFDFVPMTFSLAPLVLAGVIIFIKKVSEENLVNPIL